MYAYVYVYMYMYNFTLLTATTAMQFISSYEHDYITETTEYGYS